MNAVDMPTDVAAATRTEDLLAAVRAIAAGVSTLALKATLKK